MEGGRLAEVLEITAVVFVFIAGVLGVLLSTLPRTWLLRDAAHSFARLYRNGVIPYRMMKRPGRILYAIFWVALGGFFGTIGLYGVIFGVEKMIQTF